MNRNFCSAAHARDFYGQCMYEEDKLGIEFVHDASTLPFVTDPETVLSTSDCAFYNTGEHELAIRASFVLMPDNVKLRVREGNVLLPPPNKLDKNTRLKIAKLTLAGYNAEQVGWMQRAKEFLTLHEGRCPTSIELIENYFQNGTPVYFKVRDVMLRPELFHRPSTVLRLSDLLHGGQTVVDRLYGTPREVPRKIPAAA